VAVVLCSRSLEGKTYHGTDSNQRHDNECSQGIGDAEKQRPVYPIVDEERDLAKT